MTKDRIEWIEDICEKSGISGALRTNIRLIANDVYRLESENIKLKSKIDSLNKEINSLKPDDGSEKLPKDYFLKKKKKEKDGNQN